MIKPMNHGESAEPERAAGCRHAAQKPSWGEKLARNCAFAGILTLMVVGVRNAQLPSGQTVITAVQQMIDANWDSSLGKISFVSNLLPESMAVFFESDLQAELTAPCFGSVIHAWSETEPYLGYNADNGSVYAVSAGQVMSVAHGFNEEQIIRIRHQDGLESLYYNLGRVNVKEGDQVTKDTCLGATVNNMDPTIEVRRAGIPIDPTGIMHERSEETQ